MKIDDCSATLKTNGAKMFKVQYYEIKPSRVKYAIFITLTCLLFVYVRLGLILNCSNKLCFNGILTYEKTSKIFAVSLIYDFSIT